MMKRAERIEQLERIAEEGLDLHNCYPYRSLIAALLLLAERLK